MNCVKPIEVQGRTVPCGKCYLCLKNIKNDWSFRLNWEHKSSKSSHFITLTYNPENLPTNQGIGTLKKRDLFTFIKSLRKSQERWYESQGLEQPDYKIKFFGVGEYGTKGHRPHYHIIIFNLHSSQKERIQEIWGKGHVHIGTVAQASVAYTAKYIIDDDKRWQNNPIEKPFRVMSKNLGLNYLEKNKDWHRSQDDQIEDWRMHVVVDSGIKIRMPRYYRDKLFASDEVEAFNKLTEKERAQRHIDKFNQDEKDYGLKSVGIARRARIQQKNEETHRKSKIKNKL